jgi:hypothetical protein
MIRRHLLVLCTAILGASCRADCQQGCEKATWAKMKGYLRTIAVAESTYFSVNGRFTPSLSTFDIQPDPPTATAVIRVTDSASLLILATDPSTSGTCWVRFEVDKEVAVERERTCGFTPPDTAPPNQRL